VSNCESLSAKWPSATRRRVKNGSPMKYCSSSAFEFLRVRFDAICRKGRRVRRVRSNAG
jgi:hypothetical protein